MDLGKRVEGSGGDYWVDDPVYGLSRLANRKIGDPTDLSLLTGQQLYILRAIALAAATISLSTGVIVGWWFVRMKRSFRHQYAPRFGPTLSLTCVTSVLGNLGDEC